MSIEFKKQKYIFFVLIVFIAITHIFFSKLPNQNLKITFLNVGQGDSILIQTPALQNILIDGGPGQNVLGQLGTTMPYVINAIDLIVLTHPHEDHISGLIEVLKRYDVKKVLFSAPNYKNSLYDEFLKEINQQKISTIIAYSENDFDFGNGIFLDVLYPNKFFGGQNFININNASVVLKLIYGDHKILFTGDAEKESEHEQLMTDYDLSADVLKVGHHGSRTATTLDYLLSVNPKTAVIQVGINNKFQHPHQETLDKFNNLGIQIRRNDLEGRIEVISNQ